MGKWTAKDHAEARLEIKKGRAEKGWPTDLNELVREYDAFCPEYGQRLHWLIFGYREDSLDWRWKL